MPQILGFFVTLFPAYDGMVHVPTLCWIYFSSLIMQPRVLPLSLIQFLVLI